MSPTQLAVTGVTSTLAPVLTSKLPEDPDQIDAIVVVYLIVSFLGLAALLQFLGVYREQIRRFNSVFVRKGLQALTHCFQARFFHHSPNEIVTRAHLNMFELVVGTTVDFFYDAPNLITFTIGLLQVVSTYNPNHPLQAKVVNLVALSINYLYTMVREISMYRVARKFDDSRNSRLYKLVQHNGEAEVLDDDSGLMLSSSSHAVIASKDICKGNILRMDYGETFPALCAVVHSTETHTLINTKEESGEDCSSIFSKGDTAPYGGRVSSQGASLIVRVLETRNSILPDGSHRRMERFPEHLNKYLTVANLFALGLLSIMAGFSVFMVLFVIQEETADDDGSANHLLFVHFFSMVAQLNMLIPSMRWIILYFLFVFLVDFAYRQVTIQSHVATRRLKSVQAVYTDKTGTLTDTQIGVDFIDSLPALDELALRLNAERDLLLCVIVLACNDTQPGNGEGTSPEEMAIAEHLRTSKQCWIETNPLKPRKNRMKITVENRTIEFSINFRSGYLPAEFCRIAEIEAFGTRMVVRQGGSDRMAAVTSNDQVMRYEETLARKNPNRAFGWTVTLFVGNKEMDEEEKEEEKSFYCVRTTFTNPPRDSSEDLVKFFKSSGIAVRMLTGDALEAAKYIALKVGIVEEEGVLILRQDFFTDKEFVSSVHEQLGKKRTVTALIEGSQLLKIIEAAKDDQENLFLKNPSLNMVIYRTKSADKAVIVKHAADQLHIGCAMIGDAANDKHALALPNIVSVALRHGAAPCRVVADVVISEPGDLIDFWTSCQWLHLNGAKILLVNTCMIGALVSGLTWIGIYHNSFALLSKGFLYPDPYDTRLMLLFSSVLFAPSACAAVLGRYSNSAGGLERVKLRPFLVLFTGLLAGLLIGYIGPGSWYSGWMLSVMIVGAMTSHAIIANKFLFARPAYSERLGAVIDLINRGPSRLLAIFLYIAALFLSSRIH